MSHRPAILASLALLLSASALPFLLQTDELEAGFRNPPAHARPHIYYMLLNGHVDREHVEKELAEFARAGIGGICVFDVGARGDKSAMPPAGPAFLSPESVADLAHIIRTAGKHGMEVDLSVASSWDMGGSWVKPEDASMTLVQSSLEIKGGRAVDLALAFPAVPAETPKSADGRPLFSQDAAIIAIPAPERFPGYQFDFELRPPRPHTIDRVVLYNNPAPEPGDTPHFAREFSVSVSDTESTGAAFREVTRATLKPQTGPQEFRFPPAAARYVRLHIIDGYDRERIDLAEFEVLTTAGENVNLNHRAMRLRDSADLLRYTSARGQLGPWAADNIHDGIKEGPRGSWSSGASAALFIRDSKAIVDLTANVDAQGRLRWDAPAGDWLILRYVCVNTGEKLKVPSPNSDGLATDHFNSAATSRYIGEVIGRLKPGLGDLRTSPLKDLYLASYEVRGQVWSPTFLAEFRKRRGYDLTPFLPILNGGRVDNEQTTERVLFDFRKTQGELLYFAYYLSAVQRAHNSGLLVESEAGGPGPPIHQVPVDALLAQGAVDSVRGEFWPDRMDNTAIWVVKETASAAHIYSKPRVHMEAFTSMDHWMEGPADLKLSADRAFAEGMNHVVWHTAAHLPPLAGKPGWVYYAGTHLNLNVPWWPMAKGFLSYLARASFLLQQGNPVSDILYYYGDQGYNFVLPKSTADWLPRGHDYDVTNADVLRGRLQVRDGKLSLYGDIRYEILVLPDREDIDIDVLRKVEKLVAAGATVIGRRPVRASGFRPQLDSEVQAIAARLWADCTGQLVKGRVSCGITPAQALLQRNIGPDFQYRDQDNTADLDFIHRTSGGAEIYFVHNRKRQWETVQAEFRVPGKQPELWDADTGRIRPVDQFEPTATGTRLALTLEPEGSIFVLFRKPGTPRAQPAPDKPASLDVTGPWRVTFKDGPAAPDPITLATLRSWTASTEPREKYFSGIAEYETTLDIPAGWLHPGRPIYLDLGELWAVADVTLNGRDLGVVWKRPFRIDLTSAARPGANQLKIRVANNWVNRLVGDALSTSPRVTKTNVLTTGANPNLPWREVPLHKSGLLGPVRLLNQAEQP